MKYFTADEADALLPRIIDLLNAARDTKGRIEKKVDEWRKVHATIGPADEAVFRGQVDYLKNRLEEQLGQISDFGCIPKDLDSGLIDFPARIDDREAFLCWRFGESKVNFWHGLTDGFRGRKPLNRPE